MKLMIRYFAGLRETLGASSEEVELPPAVSDVAGLIEFLAARSCRWGALSTYRNLRYAVNQEMARRDTPLADGDEVAFFPPVTGG